MDFRLARPGDRPGITRVVAAAFDEYRAPVLEPYFAALDADLADAVTFVAVEGDTIVGAGSLVRPGGGSDIPVAWPPAWACLRRLAVAPSRRRRGIARMLAHVRVEHARTMGATAVALHTSFAPAHGLYRALGWTRVPAYDFMPAAGVRAETYALSLDS